MAIVYRSQYKQLQTLAEQDLALLEQEREHLLQKMAELDERERQLREYLQAVAPLIEQDPGQAATGEGLGGVGITAHCRQIINSSPRWMTAKAVRATLKEMGVDISRYTNPMAVLHSTLHRVASCHRDAKGKLYYGRADRKGPPGSG